MWLWILRLNLLTKIFSFFWHFSDQQNTFNVHENSTGNVFKPSESCFKNRQHERTGGQAAGQGQRSRDGGWRQAAHRVISVSSRLAEISSESSRPSLLTTTGLISLSPNHLSGTESCLALALMSPARSHLGVVHCWGCCNLSIISPNISSKCLLRRFMVISFVPHPFCLTRPELSS